MKTFSLTFLFFALSFSVYSQDTLEMMRKSNNVVAVGILDRYSPKAEIDDSVVKLKTINDIARLYKTEWTAEDISVMMKSRQVPTKMDLLNAGLPGKKSIKYDSKAALKVKDTVFYDWLEAGYKNAILRTPVLLKEAQKTNKKAVKSDYQPWVMIALEERFGYSASEIRKELKKRKINRVYIEVRKEIFEPPTYGMSEPPPPPPAPPVPEPPYDPNRPLTVIDEKAEFPGGIEALKAYISKNLVYPQSAKDAGIEGKAYVKFVVGLDGTLSDIQIAKKVPGCPECDKEVIRLFKSMPKWVPGKNKGKNTASYFTYPVLFKLPE